MRIDLVEIFRYNLPLNHFLTSGNENFVEREGLIIRLEAEGGEGFGEIAPLPGRSRESLDRALAQLQEIKPDLLTLPLPDKVEKLDGRLKNWLAKYELRPSVQFGLEMAFLNLQANSKKITLYQLLSKEFHEHVRVNGLVQGNKQSAVEQTRQLLEQGFTGIKLKVGSDIDAEINKVKAVNDVINGHALLSLDANQAWTFKEAVDFGNEIGCASVAYIEEPFKDVSQIPEFFRQTIIPVALDESLQRHSFEEVKSFDGLYTLVLKPTLLGGIEKTWELIAKAHSLAIDTVVSSSFESAIGILTLANLTGCSPRDRVAGLDTLKWFKENLLNDPFILHKGRFDISKRQIRSADINFSLLKKIE